MNWLMRKLGYVSSDEWLELGCEYVTTKYHNDILVKYLEELRDATPHENIRREIDEVLEQV